MAGSYYTHEGDGANHLCLPFDPEYVPGVGNAGGANIYGSEYRSANQINSGKRNIEHRNIPCSVCRVQMRSTAIMVPAHNSCPRGWTREYYGFLMAAHQTQFKSYYICMDREMKTLPGHAGDQGGNLLHSVATQCGYGLDCPPYQADKPMTCAVCTMWEKASDLIFIFCTCSDHVAAYWILWQANGSRISFCTFHHTSHSEHEEYFLFLLNVPWKMECFHFVLPFWPCHITIHAWFGHWNFIKSFS